jgi:hypothetical protein
MLRLSQDRTKVGAFSFPASASLLLTRRGCLLLSADGSSHCGPHFAMTINKAQGQTLQTVGVYLPKLVFGHGQLYVAFSRCGSRRGFRVLVRGGSRAPAGVYTSNVVYREVLQWFFLWVWGSLGSPLDSQFFSGLKLWFCPRGWVGLDCIRLKWGFYIYQTFPP